MFSITDVIRKMQVDALGVTPSMLATISPEKIPLSLKQITTVGEPVSSSVVHKWADLVDFRVSYGLSECAQLNFSRRLAKGDKPSIVGKPTDSTTAHIFVPGTNDLAIPGEPGELCLTGPQLSDGYLERPDETSKAFVLNPLGSGRMFRTGDHAVQHPDGNFEILGRLDFQVKLNGQRVEPEEVASVLKRHSEVDAVTVIATALGGSDSNSLIAAIVPKSKNDWNQLVSDLRELAENLLPAFMNPSHWLRLDSLPTTPTGKVDIRKIQAKAQSTPPREMSSMLSTNEDFQPVTDFVERKIAATWATILSLDRKSISRNHSFTKLGGNSMQAIQMVNKLRSEGIDLGIEALFENQDLASLRSTAIIQDMLTNESQKALIPFSLIPDEKFAASLKQEEGVLDAYPATAMQESLVALTLNGNKDYLYQRVWEVSNLDLIRLRLAFEIAFLRSDILRTTLDWTESGLFQFVRNDFQLEWKILNLSIDEYKKEDLEAGIKLGRPFFRICLLEEKYLVVSMHHSLFDFLSANFLYEDVSALYRGLRTEPRSPFKKFLQYVLKGNPESKNFWASYLEGMSPTTINHAPTSQKISATRVTPNEAEAIAARLNVTASTVYNMAWALVVSKHLDTLDVTFANTISGRDVFVDGIDRLDGPTLTVVPRRFKFDPLSTLEESLSKAHRESAQVLKHSQYGLRNALKAASQTSTSALFDTLVNILPPISTRASTSDSVFRRHGEKPIWQTEYTTVEIQKIGDDTSYTLSTDMEDIRAEFILDQVIETISKIGREPRSTIKALSIITNREIEKLNPPKLTADRDSLPQLLHGGFEAHARSHPWRVALQWQNEELISYRMLDERANRLARHLQIKGLKHGDFACLLLEKSPNMITAILAVLKAGAAYVPLSPENPVERNKFIIEETEAKLLISETVVEQALELSKLHITGVFLDDLDHSKLDPSPLHAHISGSDTCYVLYTSGSTGMPKGCVIKHSNAAAAIESMVEVEGRRKSANPWRALQFSNYTFDVSVLDIFNTLNTGGTLCMAPTERLLSDLCGAIEEMGVNHAFLTPTVARLIGPGEAPHLGSVIVGGEPMTEDVLKLMAGRRVINGYGPTEASILVTMCDNMLPGDNAKNIGKPLQTVEAFIVDKEGSDLVPYGAVSRITPPLTSLSCRLIHYRLENYVSLDPKLVLGILSAKTRPRKFSVRHC
jgi:non-ribosomal peptide synthetase component F